MSARMDLFLASLERLPAGYGEGNFNGRRYGVTVSASSDGKRSWLYGRELGGTDFVSFNLYRLAGGRTALRPCEMPAKKVVDFVLGYQPDVGPG